MKALVLLMSVIALTAIAFRVSAAIARHKALAECLYFFTTNQHSLGQIESGNAIRNDSELHRGLLLELSNASKLVKKFGMPDIALSESDISQFEYLLLEKVNSTDDGDLSEWLSSDKTISEALLNIYATIHDPEQGVTD